MSGSACRKSYQNFVSGIILLLERSIKPGDVIEVGSTFGSVAYLGARYASVRGRDGKEYLIPNENLITNEVINWSYSSPQVRLDVKFGVAYGSDLHAVRDLAVAVASRTDRVLASPRPVCHVSGFGDSAVSEKRIKIPMPQREVHIRDVSLSALSAVREAQTARD